MSNFTKREILNEIYSSLFLIIFLGIVMFLAIAFHPLTQLGLIMQGLLIIDLSIIVAGTIYNIYNNICHLYKTQTPFKRAGAKGLGSPRERTLNHVETESTLPNTPQQKKHGNTQNAITLS